MMELTPSDAAWIWAMPALVTERACLTIMSSIGFSKICMKASPLMYWIDLRVMLAEAGRALCPRTM